MVRKLWVSMFLALLLFAGMICAAEAENAAVYKLPKEIIAPSFEDCGQYTNWTEADEYTYTYTVTDPEPGEMTSFIVQSGENVSIFYPNPAEGPYGSEAELFARTQDGHTYAQVSVQCKYYNLTDQVPYAYINNVYSDQGELKQVILQINVTLDGENTSRYTAIYQGGHWYYIDQDGNNFSQPSQELAEAFAPVLSLVDMSPIQIQYEERTLDLTSFLTRETTPQNAVIDIPGGFVIPTLEECQAYTEWDNVYTSEELCLFTVDQRNNLPYRVRTEFRQGQVNGMNLEMYVSGTAADPRTDKESEVGYNALQFNYAPGESFPRLVRITTNYGKVDNLFDYAYLNLYYGSDGSYIRNGMANIGINSQSVYINYQNGEWVFSEEASALMSSDGLMEQRLAWLNAYQPRPLTLRVNPPLSIYDLMVSPYVMNLPDNLQEIESQAFIGVNADRVIIPSSVQRIADDAFDKNVLLIFSDSRLEEWAREKHPNYRINK